MRYWFDYLVEKERRKQEVAQAEANRRATHIMQAEAAPKAAPEATPDVAPRQKPRLWPRLLGFVGQQLINWGCRLQQRSTKLGTATTGLVQEPLIRQQTSRQCGGQ